MAFQIKKISNHGTANPIAARLSIQTHEVIQFCAIDKSKQEEVLALYHDEIQPRLLECDDISQEISKEILDILKRIEQEGIATQSHGRVIETPYLIRLEQRVEQFLYCAKSALRDLAKIFSIFFDAKFSEARYDKIHTWAAEKFGSDSEIAKLIKQDHDLWIKRIVMMRNAVEHPGGYSGHLHIHNFEIISEPHLKQPKIMEPTWHLNDEPKASIAQDLLVAVVNTLETCEDLLILCMKATGFPNFLQIIEIPESERSTECPIRLRVVPDRTKI